MDLWLTKEALQDCFGLIWMTPLSNQYNFSLEKHEAISEIMPIGILNSIHSFRHSKGLLNVWIWVMNTLKVLAIQDGMNLLICESRGLQNLHFVKEMRSNELERFQCLLGFSAWDRKLVLLRRMVTNIKCNMFSWEQRMSPSYHISCRVYVSTLGCCRKERWSTAVVTSVLTL